MSKSPRVVHTPGEDPAAKAAAAAQESEQTTQATEADAGGGAGAVGPAADQALLAEIAQLRAERDAALAKAQGLESDKAARDAEDERKAAATKAALAEPLRSNKPAPGVHARDVNPTTIRRAVLTAEGWVAPAAAPKHASER